MVYQPRCNHFFYNFLTFERNERFETGLKFLRISLSRLCFLSKGLTIADLRLDGNVPLAKHALTISVITGAMVGRMSHSRLVGIGSKGHEALEDFLMVAMISEMVAGLKESNLEDLDSRVSNGGHCNASIEDSMIERSVRIFDIFETKKLLKISAKTLAELCSGSTEFLPRPRSLSTIWKSFF